MSPLPCTAAAAPDAPYMLPCPQLHLLPLLQADWDMVKRGWDAHVLGVAPHSFKDALTAVKTLRVRG
jgi:hypothetical protein